MNNNTKWIIVGSLLMIMAVQTVLYLCNSLEILDEIEPYTVGVLGYIPKENVEIVRDLEAKKDLMGLQLTKELIFLSLGCISVLLIPSCSSLYTGERING